MDEATWVAFQDWVKALIDEKVCNLYGGRHGLSYALREQALRKDLEALLLKPKD